MTKPLLMGILNVTPDSFSDGGVHYDARTAIAAGLKMLEDGADILDVGGESTRPHADPVSEEEEIRRIIPVIRGLASHGAMVSVDTMKANVARAALKAGAKIVNDVTALGDKDMVQVCAEAGCGLILMHMKGDPRTMQNSPHYEDVVGEVRDYLLERARYAESHGVAKEKIWVDPGIGFGKNRPHNVTLLKNLRTFVDTGYPVLLGVSRKSFIGRILGSDENPSPVEDRLEGTLALQTLAQAAGVYAIRAHDVLQTARAIKVAQAILM